MNVLAAILLLCVLINLAVAGYVFWRRHSRASHYAFAVLALVFACWTFSNLMIALSDAKVPVILWGRAAFALATLIGLAYVVFSWCFPETYHVRRPPAWGIGLAAGTCGLVVALSVTDLIQQDAVLKGGHWQLVTGPLHWVFVSYMLAAFGWGTVNLICSRSQAPAGRERMQLNYTLTGFVLAFPVGYLTNFVAPLLVPDANVILVGGVGPAIWSLFTFYAIVRYRLMDIGIPLRASAIHAIVVVALAAFFVVPMTLFPRFEGLTGPLRVVVLLVLAVAFALIVEPLHE